MKRHLLFSLALTLSFISAIAQQKMKDGTVSYGNLPNKDAILELESANKGVLFSRVALKNSADPAPLTSHVAGMMVYNTQTVSDVVPGIYYNDGKKWVLARAGQATNLTYNPTTYSISFNDPVTNNPVVVNLQEVVKKNETLTSLVKQENGTYLYTAEDDKKTIINIPSDVINNFQTIANTSTVKQVLETIIKNTSGNVFFDGSNFTYIDKNGINQTVNLEQVIKATETVTTLVKNGDGSYTYTNEKNDKVTLSVIGDINNNIINQGALYNTIKNVVDKEETVTSLVYDATKNILTFNDENKVANTIDLSQLVLKNQLTSSLSNSVTTEVTLAKSSNNTDYKVEVKDGAITTAKLANGAVTNDKVGADAITSDKIKNGEVKSDDLADLAVTGAKVADKNIGAEKLVAKPADQGKVGVVQADGTIIYQNISATNVTGKDLTADDASIAVTDGTGATLVNSKVKVADLGITTAKLANGAVTNDKVGADAITSDKIKNGEVKSDDLADKNIGAEKLVAKPADQGKVGVVQADGTIVYQNISTTNVTGKDLTADDASIAVTDGTGATLVNSKVKVADLGITTAKLANGAVTNDKVGADAITSDKIKNGEVKTEDLADLAVTGAKVADKNIGAEKLVAKPADQGKVGVVQADGTVVYQNISATIVTGKDLTAEDNSIAVTDGTGATLVNSKVKVSDLGITTAKLANGAVTNDKVGADAITSDKIKNGEVKSDDLADKNIGAEKLVAKPADQGKVGVVQADGTIVYQNISATNVTGKDLTADDTSIAVTDGTGATLVNSKVKVADLGITTAKLANGAVTNDKVGADAITSDKIKNGEVKSDDLADKNIGAEKLVAKPADQGKVGVVQADGTVVYQNISATNLTGKDLTAEDNSIAVTDGTGATLVNSKVKVADLGITTAKLANGAVTNDKVGADAITSDKIKNGEVKTEDLADLAVTGAKVADKNIGAEKLVAKPADQGKVGVVQADGTVVYQNISATSVTGKDLTAEDNSIAVTDGTGATLVNSKVKVADLGITTAKLANGAVTNDKVSADAITSDKIKNGEVKSDDLADKNIGAEKLVAKPADQGKVGVVQADGTVVYQNISATNVTGKDLTADDASIAVTDGTGATLVNSKVKVADLGITTAKLANGAVTNDKVGADAITSDKIKNGEVKSDDLADKNIGAEKLVAKPADQGKVGVVQADGTVVYQNISATNVTGKDLTADDASIAVTDGTGATLVNSKVKVADLGITTAKLANGAVTNDKVGADAITSDKIKNGEVKTEDLADLAVTGAKVATDAITKDKIKDGSVTSSR